MSFSRAIIPVALSIMLVSFATPAQKKRGSVSRPRQPAIVVSPIDVEGFKNLIAKPRQHPLLVNFWATYCDPCRDEFPDLVKIDHDYRKHSLEFVTISLDDLTDIKTSVPKFLDSMKATMPAYLLDISDPEVAINFVDQGWQGSLPATFLYNEKGEIVYKHIGRINAVELREAIDKVIKKADGSQ